MVLGNGARQRFEKKFLDKKKNRPVVTQDG
jgi:hypothetical protein